MARGRTTAVSETAYLSGGRERAVDAALVALVERGAVRLSRTGALDAVRGAAGSPDPVEQAVLELVRERSSRSRGAVQQAARRRPELAALRDRLAREGLLRTGPLAGLLGCPWSLTAQGRERLSQQRGPGGTGASQVAEGGLGALQDRAVRDALMGRRRPSAGHRDGSSGWASYGLFGGDGGSGCGSHASSCGGGSSSCGGSGCGGGGCGGGGS